MNYSSNNHHLHHKFHWLTLYVRIETMTVTLMGFPSGPSGKESACLCRRHKRWGFYPLVGKIPWRRPWQPTPVFLPGESHGQRSLGSSTQGFKESDMTECMRARARTHTHARTHARTPHKHKLNVRFFPAKWEAWFLHFNKENETMKELFSESSVPVCLLWIWQYILHHHLFCWIINWSQGWKRPSGLPLLSFCLCLWRWWSRIPISNCWCTLHSQCTVRED